MKLHGSCVFGRCLSSLMVLGVLTACSPVAPPPIDSADDSAAEQVSTLTGLDVVLRDGGPLFAGRQLGLVVHGASVSASGQHAIDVFRDRGYAVQRLFSPEHGLRGEAEAGEQVVDGVDSVSGLPVISLYGERRAPEPEHLEDLDVLVIDLQDVGVRFYTYASTMLLSVQAGLDAGLDVVVLDRPNPLGGVSTSGPVRDPQVPMSLVSRTPGPLVHGLTLGEMALVSFPRGRAHTVPSAGRLYVVPVENWRREQFWTETGLPWRKPSPNLRSVDAARLYPAIALLEATNVSEGRGTETPFRVFGAPWFEAQLLDDLVEIFAQYGVTAEPTEFTPSSSPAARKPKFLGQLCTGLRLRPQSEPIAHYELGLSLLERLSQEAEFSLNGDGEGLTWLLGTGAATKALREGRIEDHVARVQLDNRDWLNHRAAALLYE